MRHDDEIVQDSSAIGVMSGKSRSEEGKKRWVGITIVVATTGDELREDVGRGNDCGCFCTTTFTSSGG